MTLFQLVIESYQSFIVATLAAPMKTADIHEVIQNPPFAVFQLILCQGKNLKSIAKYEELSNNFWVC